MPDTFLVVDRIIYCFGVSGVSGVSDKFMLRRVGVTRVTTVTE
jgi:hypothetical protein